MKKKFLAMALGIAVVLSCTACGGGSSDAAAPASGETNAASSEAGSDSAAGGSTTVTVAIGAGFSTLDPGYVYEKYPPLVINACYENLFKFYSNDGAAEPCLADSYEFSEDNKTLTVKLKENVTFASGNKMTSADVAFSINRCKNLQGNPSFICDTIDSIETPDDYTLVIKLTQAWAPFINRLTQFCIISPAALEEYGNDIMNHPCGTGPYVCTEWEEGDHTSFKRNDDYWGDKPGVDTVTIKEVPEAGARTAMLQTGEADFIYPTPSDQIEAIKGTDDVNILTTDSNIMRYVTLNMDLEQLSDVKVRQAMNYAIDKDAYIQLMYSGYGKPATSVVPSIIGGYEEQEAYTYDVDKAKELMKEAGYEDGFKLTLWGDNTTQEIKGMTFISQQLAQIGIEVDVQPMEPATVSDKIYVDKEDAEINMWYVNWSASDFTMDGSLRSLLYSTMCPPTSANTAYFNDADFDKDMDEGLATANEEEQAKYYSDAQKIAWEACPWLFLGNDQIIYSTKSYLSGVYVSPDGAFNFANATLAQ